MFVSTCACARTHRGIMTCARQKYSPNTLQPKLFWCSVILSPTWRSQVLAQTLSLLYMGIILTTVNGCGQYYLSKTTVRKSTKDLAELAPGEIQNKAFCFGLVFFIWFVYVHLSKSKCWISTCEWMTVCLVSLKGRMNLVKIIYKDPKCNLLES